MINYFDTSALATSAFKDFGFGAIDNWIEVTQAELAYSSWTTGEFAVAASRRVRATGLPDAFGDALIVSADVYLSSWTKLRVEGEDIDIAAEWVRDISVALSLPDALHIAIAKRHNARLITTDRQQFTAAGILGVSCFNPVRTPLEEY